VRRITGRALACRADGAYIAYLILGAVFGLLMIGLAFGVPGPAGSRFQRELAALVCVLSGATYLGAVSYAVYASAQAPRDWRLLALGILWLSGLVLPILLGGLSDDARQTVG